MNYTPSQQRAIDSNEKTILVSAGAGSGKSSTLIARIQRLVSEGVSPKSMVAITFTTHAAKVLQDKLGGTKLHFVGTLHSYLLMLIRQHGSLIGYRGEITVLSEEDAEAFLEDVISEQNWKGTKKELMEAIEKGPQKNSGMISRADVTAAAFWAKLRASKLLTFDAILILGTALLRTIQGSFLTNVQGSLIEVKGEILLGVDYWFIDELQDSSKLDHEIYALMPGNRFFCGDDFQSIFAFRGGNVGLFLDMARNPDVEVIPLEENFRSDISICEAANKLIRHNTDRFDKKTVPVSPAEGLVSVDWHESPAVEQASIAMLIADYIFKGTPANEIAVLLRTNLLVEEYANALRARSIPVATMQEDTRPDDWPKAMLALALLQNPYDDYLAHRWLTMLYGPVVANQHKFHASESFQSINEVVLKIETPVKLVDVSIFLADHCSMESCQKVNQALAEVDSIGDLMMALNERQEGLMGEGVRITTIHASKGTEADVVFIPAAEQTVMPANKTGEALAEERRLFYVAVTRARHAVFISYVKSRVQPYRGFTLVDVEPSQFIKEMGL